MTQGMRTRIALALGGEMWGEWEAQACLCGEYNSVEEVTMAHARQMIVAARRSGPEQ